MQSYYPTPLRELSSDYGTVLSVGCRYHMDRDVDGEGAGDGLRDSTWHQPVGRKGQEEAHLHQDSRRHPEQAKQTEKRLRRWPGWRPRDVLLSLFT